MMFGICLRIIQDVGKVDEGKGETRVAMSWSSLRRSDEYIGLLQLVYD